MSNRPQKSRLTAEQRRELLAQLVDEHGDALYRHALRFFRSEEAAQEVIQETFLAATQAIDGFEGRSSHRTWLQGILRFKMLDRLRMQKRARDERRGSNESWERDLPSEESLFNEHEHWLNETGPLTWSADPEKIAEQKDFLQTLEQCLQKFPEHIRQLFLLREVEGYSREELCDQFDLSSSNVGVILFRVRAHLQRCLQINWFEEQRGGRK